MVFGSLDYNLEAPSASGVFALMRQPGKDLPLIALAFLGCSPPAGETLCVEITLICS